MHRWLTVGRSGARTGAVVLACAAVVAGIIGVNSVLNGEHSGQAGRMPADRGQAASAPDDGWRWESYQTIEVQVPEDWDYGVTGSPPCLVKKAQRPYVGRPGGVRAIGCRDPLPPLAYRASYLWFDSKSRNPADHGWVEETRLVDGLQVTVLSDDDSLRRRILDSARLIDGSDANGCTPSHPLADLPHGRPPSNGGLASLGSVESVAVCRYAIGVHAADRRAPLIASSAVTGDAATTLVDAIASASEGSGPNDKECTDTYGSEILVLKIQGSNHDQEVLIRYSGCSFNGTDDGVTLRQLTANLLQPILTGIHRPWSYTQTLYELVVGPVPPK